MDALKDQFERIRQQLAGLTASQRMVVGMLVAVMAVTILYWGKYAGSPEMVSVTDQPLSDEDAGPINNRLSMAGITHTFTGGKVLVPSDRKAEVLADLIYAQELPHDTHWAFDEMTAKELTPFASDTERGAVYNHATEMEVSGLIRRWPGVADARVVINNKNDMRIGESIPPSATVDVRTRGPADAAHTRQIVRAAADAVTGAVSGMSEKNVRVIVDGQSMRPPASGTDLAGIDGPGTLELQEKNEAFFEQKVRDHFHFIAGLTVAVTCDVENTTRVDNVHKVDKDGAITLPTYEHTQSSDQKSTDANNGGEPGVATNLGTAGANVAADASAGGGAVSTPVTTGSTSSEESTTASTPYVPTTDSTINTPAGKGTVRSAAVCVPMSYVVRVAKSANPGGKEPTRDELNLVATAETARVRNQVAKVVGLASADSVSVDTFADDNGAVADLAMAAGPSNASAALGGLGSHAKEIAVGTLAVLSLGLMFHMSRKGGTSLPAPSPSLAGLNGLQFASGDDDADDAAGDEVGSTSSLLGGMAGVEVDEETLRTQQMLDQVSTLVKEDPDAAAALVKRWVTRA